MVSCDRMFHQTSTTVNKKISDHNIMSIQYEHDMKWHEKNIKSNCYSRKIYEYDIDENHSGWDNFYECINAINIEELESLSHDDIIQYLYEIVDNSAEKILEKKKFFLRRVVRKGKSP